jgi:hypothetical protein
VIGAIAPSTTRHPSLWDTRLSTGTPLLERVLEPCIDLPLNYPESGVTFELYRTERQTEGVFYLDRPAQVLLREGWIVEDGLRLHERSQIAYETRRHRPGLRRYIADSLLERPVRSLECAISLRSRGDSNFYHALNDVLGSRVRLLQESSVSPRIPVIVSQNLASQPFFQYLRRSPGLSGREIVVQRNGRVRCDHLYYLQSATLNVANIEYAVQALGVPVSDPLQSDRIFVARRPPAIRAIENSAEVEDLVARYGFTVVDTSTIPLGRQIEIFSRAALVVGVHGAGLTNIAFRRSAPLHLVEIFDRDHLRFRPPQPHYMVIAESLGFGYTPVMSAARQGGGSLIVDVAALERTIVGILRTES